MMTPAKQIYPRSGDNHTVYLNQVITNPNIIIGDWLPGNVSVSAVVY